MSQLIECVPNISEGRDKNIIKQVTDQVETVEGVRLIDVDPGKATNRTVITFVGAPEAVCEAAFLVVKKAAELIDMSKHSGAHPRFGATDVCPLVPVANISMEETAKYARKLAERIGSELSIPIFCYEHAALIDERRNLATCRSGEYEALRERLANPRWRPDFGPAEFNARVKHTGVTAVGARNFLVAYNVNLNTTSTRRANAIAFDVRERGRTKREGNPITGKIAKDESGKPVMIPGMLKSVKAIGWFIEEYGIAQISMNLTDITVTSVHEAFDAVVKSAASRGIRVTGSELVGVIPLKAMLDAGKHYLRLQERSTGIPDREIIRIAVKSLGLDELGAFEADKKIIEYILADHSRKKLVDMTLVDFANETASESPAPGGGSIAASMGAMGASLSTMVANLSSHKRGWDERWEEFSEWAEKGKYYQDALMEMVDKDTEAFNKIMDAFGLPKNSETEKNDRTRAIQAATRNAIEVPFQVMELCYHSMEVARAMAESGNPNSVSDAGVGAIAALAGVKGAYLNVKINVGGLDDKDFVEDILTRAKTIHEKAAKEQKEILNIVEKKL